MTIQDLGSLGELIAAIATLATLIYLARQISANTKATQASSRLEITRDYRTTGRILFDPEINRAWAMGFTQYPSMSFEQNGHFANYMSDQALLIQGVFAQYEHKQLEEETYIAYLVWFCSIVATPGGSYWWDSVGRPIFVPKMVAAVDERISQGDLPDLRKLPSFNTDGLDENLSVGRA
jgi:hypothetical protein